MMNTFPFHSLQDDDFMAYQSLLPSDDGHDHADQYETDTAKSLNEHTPEYHYHIDPNDTHTTPPSSKYFTLNQFSENCPTNQTETFSILHTNIRSLNKHFDQLQHMVENANLNLSVIGISETWLRNEPHPTHNLRGYTLENNNRKEKAGGGVAMYISSSLNYTPLPELNLMSHAIESVFVEITTSERKNIIIGTVYRPPNCPNLDFITSIQTVLSSNILENKHCFIMGDFNINLLNAEEDSLCQDFLDAMYSHSFIPLINKPTRITNTSATLIDNIFSNYQTQLVPGILLSDISDHFPVFSHIPIQKLNKNSHTRVPGSRKFTEENMNKLKDSLEIADWSNILRSQNADEAFNLFLEEFMTLYNRDIPIQQTPHFTQYKKTPRQPWVTKSLLRCINRKNRLFYRYKSNASSHNEHKYKNYKNRLISILRVTKKEYFSNQFEIHKNDMKCTWKIINNALNRNPSKSHIQEINTQGTTSKDPAEIAQSLNDYFVNIGPNLAQNIPPSDNHFSTFLENPNPKSIFFSYL